MMRLGFLGFGHVGRALCRLLLNHPFGGRFSVTGISTARHGSIVSPQGLDIPAVLDAAESGRPFGDDEWPAGRLAAEGPCDVILELTPLVISSGEPATRHIRTALEAGRHVVSANKGPIAFHYRDLRDIAQARRRMLLFESTVMDGTPVFNLARTCLRGCKVLGFKGILNTTTNFLLDSMSEGRSFADALEEAQRRGFAEADPALDVEGWDAAAKTAVLLNVLMAGDTNPTAIERRGIRSVGPEKIRETAASGMRLKLVCEGWLEHNQPRGRVAPVAIPLDDPFALVKGTSSILSIETDLMGAVVITEVDPELPQTAYGVFSDLLTILEST